MTSAHTSVEPVHVNVRTAVCAAEGTGQETEEVSRFDGSGDLQLTSF